MFSDLQPEKAADHSRLSALAPARSATAHFAVTGLSCPGCAEASERMLRRQPGIMAAVISYPLERGRIRFDPRLTDAETVVRSLESLGYQGRLIGDAARRRPRARENHGQLQLVAAIALGMQVMSLSVGLLYPAYAAGTSDAPETRAVQYLSWLLATPLLFYGGSSFFRGAWLAFRGRTATMDTLVALGTLSAYGYSAYVAAVGGGHVYFDSVAMITVFVVLGRHLETMAAGRARKSVRSLLRLQPDTAWLRDGATWREVRSETLAPGHVILVKQGERAPTEGRILSGRAAFDEALLTGESAPIDKAAGDAVFAGTFATHGAVECAVTHAPNETRLAEIVRTVERTLAVKPPVQRLADTAAGWFAAFVLASALVTFLGGWLIAHDLADGLLAAVAVLVVACPCALGLATPLALTIALGRATERGLLVRNFAALETAGHATRVVFDKTGTLTNGRMSVTAVVVAEGSAASREELLALAAAVEQHSEHPVARAMVEAVANAPRTVTVRDFEAVPGQGVAASVSSNGRHFRLVVGSRAYVGADESRLLEDDALPLADRGDTIVWVARDGELVGFVALRDEPNPSAHDALVILKSRGIRATMLSGDHPRTVRAIAQELDLADADGRCTPTGKAERIQAWQARGEKVVMVGDGVNDAPALAKADVSIAMGSGTDVAGHTSDVVLMRPDLTLVAWFVGLSRRTRRVVVQNLTWAFAYNALMVPLAAAGAINPMVAAGAMALSSLLVVGNSLRLSRERSLGISTMQHTAPG